MERSTGRRLEVWGLIAVGGLGGCSGTSGGTGDDGVTQGSTADATTATTDESADSDASSSGGGTTGGLPPSGDLAVGIDIEAVSVNQAVALSLSDGTDAPVVRGRPARVRVATSLAADWERRGVVGRLVVRRDGAKDVTQVDRHPVGFFEGDAEFEWVVAAEHVQPGAQVRIDLLETDGPAAGDTQGASFPADEPFHSLAVGEREHVLDLVMQPLSYSGPGCSSAVSITESEQQFVEDFLYQTFPITRVEVDWRSTYDWTTSLSSHTQIHDFLGDMRQADQASPQTFYVATVPILCGTPYPDSSKGYARGKPATDPALAEESDLRVASTAVVDARNELLASHIAHVLANAHGSTEVQCPRPSTVQEDDPSYPVADGLLDGEGYGVLDKGRRPTSQHYTLLSWCNPTWVSAYDWRLLWRVHDEFASWGEAGGQ